MDNFEGYLFAKLFAIGSKSEGPEYFLQQLTDNKTTSDTQIRKKSDLWKIDPVLHPFLAHKVLIEGELKGGKLEYSNIGLLNPPPSPDQDKLKLALRIAGEGYNEIEEVLRINIRSSNPHLPPSSLHKLDIVITVEWPFQSIWHGECASSQLYDFYITDSEGKTIWQWSKSMIFAQNKTSVNIPGGSPIEFPVLWDYQGEALEKMETLNISAVFLATGQEITKKIKLNIHYVR